MRKRTYKKLALLSLIMIIVVAASSLLTVMINSKDDTGSKDKITIATSFYPMYIATLNVTQGVENVNVVNLMQQQQGCLHDYQLTTENMRTLEGAKALVVNGAGMEAFLDDIKANDKNLSIIDSSHDISLLTIEGEVHDHDHEDEHKEDADHDHDHEDEEDGHEEHDHDHGDYNAHIWMDPARYIKQVQNIADGLSKADEANKEKYQANAKAYIEKIEKLQTEFKELKGFDYNKVILFHNSMDYLCNSLGIDVAFELNVDGETSLSAGEVAEVIEEVKENNIKVLFSEKQYDSAIAERISKETGAKVYVFDSMVSGENDINAYLKGMHRNMELLKEALYK